MWHQSRNSWAGRPWAVYETTETGAQSASGDTIVNTKIGGRFGLGDYNRQWRAAS